MRGLGSDKIRRSWDGWVEKQRKYDGGSNGGSAVVLLSNTSCIGLSSCGEVYLYINILSRFFLFADVRVDR